MVAPAPSSATFADLLRHHRIAAGLTQGELAVRAQLSLDAISTLERGVRRRPRTDTVVLLSDALGLQDEERDAFAAAARGCPVTTLAAVSPSTGNSTAVALAGQTARSSDLSHNSATFHFAGVDGLASLLRGLGDRSADVLAAMQALLATVWATQDGRGLDTKGEGDRIVVVFACSAYAGDALGTRWQVRLLPPTADQGALPGLMRAPHLTIP
jgi:transcriptional regulator with XRE-family HTH domain